MKRPRWGKEERETFKLQFKIVSSRGTVYGPDQLLSAARHHFDYRVLTAELRSDMLAAMVDLLNDPVWMQQFRGQIPQRVVDGLLLTARETVSEPRGKDE